MALPYQTGGDPVTKRGAHGTLYLHDVELIPDARIGQPSYTVKVWAYDAAHARLRLEEDEDVHETVGEVRRVLRAP